MRLMKNWSIWTVVILLSIVTVGLAPSDASAGDLQPMGVVSLASYNALKADIKYVGKISGNPELAAGVEFFIKVATKGRGLVGLDKTRPIGVVTLVDPDQIGREKSNSGNPGTAVLLLPVNDLSALLGSLENAIGKPRKLAGGLLQLGKGNAKPGYLKQVGAWAMISDQPVAFDAVGANPARWLTGMNRNYDLAVRIHLGRLPESARRRLVDQFTAGIEKDLDQRKPDESDDQYAARKILGRQVLRMGTKALTDMEQLALGWTLDQKSGRAFLDATFLAKPGSPTAKTFATSTTPPSTFAGFGQLDPVFNVHWATEVSLLDSSELNELMEIIRRQAGENIDSKASSPQEAEGLKRLANNLLDVLHATLDSAPYNGGLAVRMGPDELTIALGGRVLETDKLESTLREAVNAATADDPSLKMKIKLDAGEYKGVTFHRFTAPVDENDKNREEMVKMLGGETFPVLIGIGPEQVYVALGRLPEELLHQVIDGSEPTASAVPLEAHLAMGTVMERAAAMSKTEKDRRNTALLADLLKNAGGLDHVNATFRPIPRGVQLRVELEPAIIKAIGGLISLQQQGKLD